MSLADTIRDADLLEQLAKVPAGSAFYDTMVRSLLATQRKRDDETARLAALTPAQRKREAARRLIADEGSDPNNLRHIHSVLAICALPYTRQAAHVREYQRSQGRMSLILNAGKLLQPDGQWAEQPLPYGSRARLLLLHLCSEAIRQKSPVIEIQDSLTAFIHAIGYPVTGGRNGTLHSFKQQINALAACSMRIGVWDGANSRTVNTQPFSQLDVWFPTAPDQRVLWPSTITFSREFYDTLAQHALPVNVQTVRHFAQSPRKLDLVFWLGFRLKSLRAPLVISWASLKDQFGQGYGLERQFRASIAQDFAHIREIFPKLPISWDENGITVTPADPSVLAIPLKRPAKSA